MFATTPIPVPRTEAAAEPMERTLGPMLTAAAADTPVIPAPAAVTAMDTAPPMAMLWAVANKLPATTFPIPACIPAAAVPDREFQLVNANGSDFGFSCIWTRS
jgi:hypothetical protein